MTPLEARRFGEREAVARRSAEVALAQEVSARAAAEAEIDRMRREIERLRDAGQ